ncbi:unnamed protein product [Mortierella alpina]
MGVSSGLKKNAFANYDFRVVDPPSAVADRANMVIVTAASRCFRICSLSSLFSRSSSPSSNVSVPVADDAACEPLLAVNVGCAESKMVRLVMPSVERARWKMQRRQVA